MGNNAGPHLANIYLHIYEFNYVKNIGENQENFDPSYLQKLMNIFRIFLDDLLVLNDRGVFSSIIADVYPAEMIVNNTNLSSSKCTYIDLLISIYKGKFLYRLYDKRKDFNFNVISFPFLCGNIPKSTTYGVFLSQLVRYCEVNCNFSHFKNDVIELSKKLCNQGFELKEIARKFDQFYESKINIWSKFGEDIMKYKNVLLGVAV